VNGRGRIAIAALMVGSLIAAAVFLWHRGGKRREATHTGSGSSATAGNTAGASGGGAAPAWFGVASAGDRRISGTVFVGTKPGPAKLELRSIATDTGAMKPVAAATAPDGTFTLGGLRAGLYRLQATAPGSVPTAVDVSCVAGDATRVEIYLSPCRAMVKGEVRDASGGPIVGASIETDGFPVATTDAEGHYQLCLGVAANLTARAEGYASATRALRDQMSLQLDFELVPEAVVDVLVVDEAEAPVAGALVTAALPRQAGGMTFGGPVDDEELTRPMVATTGADGHATLRGVPDTAMRLVATTGRLATAESELLQATPGKTTQVTLRVVTTVTLRGTTVDEADKPVAGVRLHWIVDEAERGAAESGADGAFVFEHVPPGNGAFSADAPDRVANAAYTAAKDAAPVKLVVERAPTVSGRVLRGGAPVPGADVTWVGFGREGVTSASDGTYALPQTGFFRGISTIQAASQALGAFGTRDLEITATTGPLTGIDIELQWGGAISGTVVDQNGAPVAGVTVSWESSDQSDYGAGTTGPDGGFVAAQLRGGMDYTPTLRFEGSALRPPGGEPWPGTPVPENGKVDGVKLVAKVVRTTVSGVVVDASGAPVADAVVRLQPAMRTGRSGADGAFSFTTTNPGAFLLEARSGDRAGVVGGVQAGAKDVRIVVGDPGKIHLTCGGDIQGGRVIARTGPRARRPQELACGETVSVPAGFYSVFGDMWTDVEVEVLPGKTVEAKLEPGDVTKIEAVLVPPAGTVLDGGQRCTFLVSDQGGARQVSMMSKVENGVATIVMPYGSTVIECETDTLSGKQTVELNAPTLRVEIKLTKTKGK
jgi:hypothetical protein